MCSFKKCVQLALGATLALLQGIAQAASYVDVLTFMFLWNMIGALILIPALSWFLLRKTGSQSRPTHSPLDFYCAYPSA
ncbi:hypothetical protein [Pseudomonas sp. R5(2019)]|uniref:hypothetical protein n=1 Tax=Pseudomonas sp. R5(2019) TaxID=2697566 RepID=UPI001412E909|nr:hypothetical protein [Pseudomonas sp. R5(2019)]NBA96924.1 hypothetical protein [Pseudomonas sp. R5(2019)]